MPGVDHRESQFPKIPVIAVISTVTFERSTTNLGHSSRGSAPSSLATRRCNLKSKRCELVHEDVDETSICADDFRKPRPPDRSPDCSSIG
jgi:hypothetical protein